MSGSPLPLVALIAGALIAGALCRDAQAASLDEVLAATEASSPSLQLVHEQTVQAEALRSQAWALLSPKVQGQGSYTINEYEIALDLTSSLSPDLLESLGISSDPIIIQQKTAWAANVSVIQPLIDARSMPLLMSAYRNLDAVRADEREARSKVRAGVAKVYYGVAVAREGAGLAQGALDSAKNHLSLASQQVQAGLAPPRAELQAQLAVARAERDLASAREGVVTAQEAFLALTGLPSDTAVELPAMPTDLPASLDDALVEARADRPALQAAEYRAAAASLQRTASHLGWLPTIDGRFTYSYSQNTAFSDDPTMWMVVFSANWLAWDGGARVAQNRTSASQARQADLMVEQSSRDADQAVRVAWERLERANSNLSGMDKELALAAENLRLADAAFKVGGATWLEVEDARLGLFAAQMSALQERANRDLAAVDLLDALGRY